MEEVLVPEGKPLSEIERVVDTFIAPSKTFTDILRSASWWLPFVLFLVFGMGSAFAIQKTVGFDAAAQKQMEKSPQAAERMSTLPPDVRARQIHISAMVTEGVTAGFGVLLLLGCLFFSLVYWATLNFALGAKTTFGQVLAVNFYALLPRLLLSVLNIVFLFAGVNTENYDISNPVGTNLGYYMPNAAAWLRPWLQAFDAVGIWTIILLIIGFAIISRKSKGQAAAVVLGWNILFLIIASGVAAIFS